VTSLLDQAADVAFQVGKLNLEPAKVALFAEATTLDPMCPIGLGYLTRLLVEQEEAASFPPGLLQAPHHVGIRFHYPGLRLAPEPRGQEGRGPEAALDPVESLGGGGDAGIRGVEQERLLTEGEAVGGVGVQAPDQLHQTVEL